MERKLETLLDTVDNLQASIVDVHELKDMCKEQQALTMRRVASWLRMNGRIRTRNWEVSVGKELDSLAAELDYLSTIALQHQE
ncbi:hypothetical protein CL634_03570 [bacterium]|nr:hypothetical protein [bacterium]